MFNKFIPYLSVNSIYDIDFKALQQAGVQGIITDLDNTLVGAKVPNAHPKLMEWLQMVQARGFQVVIVSNNNRIRVSSFAEPLAVPFIWRAKKPSHYAFRKALGAMGLKPKQAVVIGDQLLTDVLGGNRMGLYTILVNPISRGDEGFFTKMNRRIEHVIYTRLQKKGLIPWEDEHGKA